MNTDSGSGINHRTRRNPKTGTKRPKLVRQADPGRRCAFEALRLINSEGGYANLVVSKVIAENHLNSRDAAFVVELVNTTCRAEGTLNLIIEKASGRKLKTMQPGVIDVLRLAATQLLLLGTPAHAGVGANVDLAGAVIGQRVTGLVNAIARKIGSKTLTQWLAELTKDLTEPDQATEKLAITTMHPQWIVEQYRQVLPAEELEQALLANNIAPTPTLVVRPGLAKVSQLSGAKPAKWSRYGAYRPGNPADLKQIVTGKAGVQDEGSQLVTIAAAKAQTGENIDPNLPWLDMCAGPGGKTALLTGLAIAEGKTVLAAELAPHRAKLVNQAVRAYPAGSCQVIEADSTNPPWGSESFAKAILDAPCSGLGALRRRPEARWRKTETGLKELVELQKKLIDQAITSVPVGGVVSYITCSPTEQETAQIVSSVAERVEILDAPSYLTQVPNCRAITDPRFIQLWPHRHQTDAMFCALLRRTK